MPRSILPSVPNAKAKPGETRSQRQRAEVVCLLVADGLSMRKACIKVGLHHGDFLKYVSTDKALEVQYAQAKDCGIDTRVDALREQADDVMAHAKTAGPNASSYVSAFATKARVVQWDAEKLSPKKYGAKLDLNHSGSIDLAGALNAARKRSNRSDAGS